MPPQEPAGRQPDPDRRPRRSKPTPKPGAGSSSGGAGGAGRGRNSGRSGQPQNSQHRGGQGGRNPREHRPPPHRLKLDAGGRGMELRCEAPGCDFVLWPVPNPTVKNAVELAHRAHRGDLRFDSGWYGTCSCGWTSPKVSQDLARTLQETHEREQIAAAARP